MSSISVIQEEQSLVAQLSSEPGVVGVEGGSVIPTCVKRLNVIESESDCKMTCILLFVNLMKCVRGLFLILQSYLIIP
jgi:hypothetical protein